MREFPAMRKFLKFVVSQMQQRERLLFSEKPEIFLDKTINNAILKRDLLDWIHKKRSQAHIDIGDIETLFGQRQVHRYDVIVTNYSDDKGGLLANLINRCAIYSTFVFVFGVKKEKIEAIAPKTLEDLYAVVQTDEQFVCIEPKLFFVSKMVAYSYFNEVPYKRLFSCVISQEKLEKMVFCKKAADIAKDKMVVGLIKDNLDELERTDGFVDKDLNFCVLGIPNRNIQWQQLSLDSQFDAGTIVDISHTSTKVLDEDQVDKWGNSDLLPKVLIPYLHELLKHSAKEILRILKIGNGKGIYSKEIYGGQYSLFSITVGQYIPSQKGCCTFACYYLDRLDSSALRIKNTATALYAQLSSFILEDARNRFLAKSVQTAIGSIMSRNGSHNIGSHVLAALSHNVGTMPDDQVLYQYIQHRMDYIATATTERPTWSQPTRFVGEMVKRFLSQRHLLNFISQSEGLKAWEFQSDKAQLEGSGGRIKFHIRKVSRILQKVDPTTKSNETKSRSKLVDDVDVVKDFIDYSEKKPAAIGLEHDVSLAIPGGVVGQHAFFTIIENIVRNAAKHDWSTPPKLTRCLKYEALNDQVDVTKLNPRGCLDVYIDYEDTPENLDAQFVIWTRLSDVYSADNEMVCKEEAELTDEEVDDWLKKERLQGLPLHAHQQVELARPFIGEDGSLRRENWGMAEMKISAGYLQKATIEAIGGIDKKGRSIITPCAVPDSWAHNKDDVKKLNDEDRKEIKKVYHLGYRFRVPKAKLILFLVRNRPKLLSKELEVELQRGGIYISLLENVDCSTELSYQYVVMDEFGGDTLKWMLPFRIIVTQSCDSCVESKVPLLFGEKTIDADAYLDEVISASNKDSKKISLMLQESICACWVRHLVSKRGFDGSGVSLRVSTKVSSQDTSSGKSLATPEDVVEFAFNEGLEKALDTYEVACKDVEGFLVNKKIIDVLRGLKDHLVYERQGGVSKKEDKKQDVSDYSLYIKRQLKKWLEPHVDSDPDIRGAVAFLSGETANIEELEKSANAEMDKLDALDESSEEYKKQKRKWSDIDDKLNAARNALVSPIASLVLYLDSYCAQIQGLLSKYAEKIATLPKGFSIGAPREEFNCDWSDANICAWSKDEKRSVLRYWRHETKKDDSDVYLEALSGTQSYLSTLEKISNNDYPLISRLVENALLRILIIDERTREFLEKHDSMMPRFENMGIFVANDKKVDAELELLEKGCSALEAGTKDAVSSGFVDLRSSVIFDIRDGYKRYEDPQAAKRKAIEAAKVRFSGKYDAIIIHQGIIDKWLPGASHDPQKVAAFIQSLKSVFRYVVITTGRGTPANIPHSARVLPFSTIQTTLFKQYPEKMILTDAIMNILPVKAVKKGVDNG